MNKKYNFFFVIFCSLIFILKVFYFSQYIPLGGDAVLKWEIARSLAFSKFENFSCCIHHDLRWGSWLIQFIFIKIFSSEIYIYYISNFFIVFLSTLILSNLVKNETKYWLGIIFFFLVTFNPSIDKYATYNQFPSNSILLPLTLLLIWIKNFFLNKEKELKNIFILSILFFWVYGVKETYILFFPFFYFYLIFKKKYNLLFFSLSIFLILYVIETIFFNFIDNHNKISNFGRLFTLIDLQQQFKSVKEFYLLDALIDNGLFLRWFIDDKINILIYTIFLLSIHSHVLNANMFNLHAKANLYSALILALSYIFFCTSAFSNLDGKIIPMLPVIHRFNTALIPIVLFYIFILNYEIYKKSDFTLKKYISVLPVFSLFFMISLYYLNYFKNEKNAQLSHILNKYDSIFEKILSSKCVISEGVQNIYLVKMIPDELADRKKGNSFPKDIKFSFDGTKVKDCKEPILFLDFKDVSGKFDNFNNQS